MIMFSSHHAPPPGQAPGKREAVEAMFDDIAPRYDLLNRLLSLGVDRAWRAAAIDLLRPGQAGCILDVATGTADLAIKAVELDPERVVGVDVSEVMLAFGRKKIERLNLSDRVELHRADAAGLPFPDARFDAALVGFGVRNFENLQAGLQEIHRVLRPGGALVVLEFSHPDAFPFRQAYAFYMHTVLPFVGRMVSGHAVAYDYLPASVDAFPSGPVFCHELSVAGYGNILWKPLTFGIASLYRGHKQDAA